jgi:hypothetical protein
MREQQRDRDCKKRIRTSVLMSYARWEGLSDSADESELLEVSEPEDNMCVRIYVYMNIISLTLAFFGNYNHVPIHLSSF